MTRGSLRGVSLFSNCGAGDLGYAEAGFKFDVMAELHQRRLDVALLNHPDAHGVVGDLRETWPDVVAEYRARHGDAPLDLLTACPPCQGMSSARSGMGPHSDATSGSRDSRNLLVTVIHEVARALKPRVLVVENVPAFLTRRVLDPNDASPISAAQWLTTSLALEYQAFPLSADLADYGVPQSRRRAFLTFVRRDEPASILLAAGGNLPYPIKSGSPRVSVETALASFGLPALDASSLGKATDPSRGGMHSVPVWSADRYRMVAATPPGGSAWQNSLCLECNAESRDLTEAICANCGSVLPRPTVRQADGRVRLVKGFGTSYSRMKLGVPAATITTASGHIGSDLTIHPTQNRLLSPLECARLQTFPVDFEWGESMSRYGATFVREIIGEAVPPLFTAQHGVVLKRILAAQVDAELAPVSDGAQARERMSSVARADGRPLPDL